MGKDSSAPGRGGPARWVAMGERLLRQAREDLGFAQRNVEIGGYYIAASLAHGAAERALKAAHWHLRAEEPPWTHDLGAIAERVAEVAGPIPGPVDEAIARLEPLFEVARYPSHDVAEPIPAELITEAHAQSAMRAAQEVMAWAEELLRRAPGRPRPTKRS